MTAQRSSSDKPCKEIVNRRLFKNELCRNWPQLILFFATFTIFLVIPISFIMNSAPVITNPDSEKASYLISSLTTFIQTIPVMSVLLGVFSGLMTVTHLNNKVAVGFWHSLPISREGLLLTGISVRSIYYLISSAANAVIAMLLIGPSHCLPKIMPELMLTISYAVAYFAMYYAITLFAGMITGTGATRFLMTGFIIFAPVVTSALLLWIFGYSADLTDTSYYYDTVISPLIPSILADEGILKCIIFVIAAIIFFALTFILYKIRKSEAAGIPVSYRVAEEIVRYTCMFCATSVVGMIFDALFDGIGIIVGFAIGALFSFAAINAVFKKSARAMFSNIKSLAIFALAFAAVFIFFGLDVANLDEAIPSPMLTKRIELSDGGLSYEFTSKDDIKFVSEALEKLIESSKKPSEEAGMAKNETADTIMQFHQYYTLNVEIHPHIGLPIVKQISCEQSYLTEFFANINQRISSEKLIKSTLKECKDHYSIAVSSGDYYASISNTDAGSKELYNFLVSHADHYTKDNTNDTIIGTIRFRSIRSNSASARSIPIYSRDTELISKINQTFKDDIYLSGTEESLAANVAKILVLDKTTNTTYQFTDKDDIKAIASSLTHISTDNRISYPSFIALTDIDTRYSVMVTAESDFEYRAMFRAGQVPKQVTDLLK